jgi:hypothetical protein
MKTLDELTWVLSRVGITDATEKIVLSTEC